MVKMVKLFVLSNTFFLKWHFLLSLHFPISQKNAIFDIPNQTISEGYTKSS